MKPIFAAAKKSPRRVIYAEGEDERTLRAAQIVIEEGLAHPILIGRPQVIETRLKRFGLSLRMGEHFSVVNPEDDPRYRDYVALYLERAGRRGVTPDLARTIVRTNSTVIAALSVLRGDADAMICGLEGRYPNASVHDRRRDRQKAGRLGLRRRLAADHQPRRALRRRHLCDARTERRSRSPKRRASARRSSGVSAWSRKWRCSATRISEPANPLRR